MAKENLITVKGDAEDLRHMFETGELSPEQEREFEEKKRQLDDDEDALIEMIESAELTPREERQPKRKLRRMGSSYCDDDDDEIETIDAENFDFRTINGLGVSKEVAGGLALCLGGLGAHYFYCRKYTAGLIFLAISILSCGFLAIIPIVISIIQGIMILTKDIDYLLITFVNNDKKLPLF